MFRASKPIQPKLFTSGDSLFSGKSLSIYENTNSWHNLFREKVTNQIDETLFKPLFIKGKGTPNASIKVLISMMVLKEAQGLSDEKLFESCRFNMLTRSAIGLLNADDSLPTESTYYLFRKKVNDSAKKTETNLFDAVFSSISKSQSNEFEISGKRIRMDSKLLGSNIAWLSRYELVHETLSLFYKEQKKNNQLAAELQEKLDTLLKFKAKNGVEKWRIKTEKGYRYFTQKEINTSKLRKKIEQTPKEILQKRNNVEASIFQLGYHYSNAKSRYRGLIKHQMWANMRCLWVNFVRLLKYINKTNLKTAFFKKTALKLLFEMFISTWKLFLKGNSIQKRYFYEN